MMTRGLFFWLLAAAVLVADACTSVAVGKGFGSKGNLYLGRTMELAMGKPFTEWALSPYHRGEKMGVVDSVYLETMCDNRSMQWVNNLAFIAIGSSQLAHGLIIEGMNEKGFTASSLTMRGAQYQPALYASSQQQLCHIMVLPYLLGKCSSLADAKRELENMTVYDGIGNNPTFDVMKLHWHLADRSGKVAVVEYVGGKFQWSDDEVGVLTNDPPRSWHVTNLQNYVALSNTLPGKSTEQNSVPGAVHSLGTNLLGLPGDWSPASRFVRMYYLREFAAGPKDNSEQSKRDAKTLVQGLLNTVHIVDGTVGDKPLAAYKEKTDWAVIKDPTDLLFYARSYSNMTWKIVNVTMLTAEPTWMARGELRPAIPLKADGISGRDVTDQLV